MYSKPLGFIILYQNSIHAYHVLHWCSYCRNIFTHILPIADLKQMLSCIEETLSTTKHLPVSSEDTLHFYRYWCNHVLIANKQFLLLIGVAYTGSYATALNLQNFYFGYSSQKFDSMVWCQYPISWSYTGWDYGSRNFITPILHILGS